MGIRLVAHLGSCGSALMGAAGDGVGWFRIDCRNGGSPRPSGCRGLSGLMMAGTVLALLLRVLQPWVRFVALCVAGAVGLVEVVTMGVLVTL